MKKYRVSITRVSSGFLEIKAPDEEKAIEYAQGLLDFESDQVSYDSTEATADFAEEITED